MAPTRSLEELRLAINEVDNELLDLLNRRARLAQDVGAVKHESRGEHYVPERERRIIDRLRTLSQGPFPAAAIRPVFQEIISACLSIQARVKVAYLGPEATFTHQAVHRHFGSSAQDYPCGSVGAVFEEVKRGAVDFGVVPVENSTEGVVSHTLDCFLDSDVLITAEVLVNIEQCLLGRRGLKESGIERVYSHPQALAQCRTWLQSNLPNAALVQTASTAEAARASHADSAGAAIAAELAARVYSLDVLRQPIQDQSDNATRFLVIGHGGAPARRSDHDKTTVLLVLPDESDDTGALYRVLEPLYKAGVNLSKIESRPSKKRAWDYVFFIDLVGNKDDENIAAALDELRESCELLQVVGSYPRAEQV